MVGHFLIPFLSFAAIWTILVSAKVPENIEVKNLRKCDENALYGLEITNASYNTVKNIFKINSTLNIVAEVTDPFEVRKKISFYKLKINTKVFFRSFSQL